MNLPVPTEREQRVSTRLGALRVRIIGSGTTAVFWPSMFVDSSTWDTLLPHLDGRRRFVLVDGPGLGLSDPLLRRSDIDEAADAAADPASSAVRTSTSWRQAHCWPRARAL